MTTKTLARRLAALEIANQPPGAVAVCWCSKPDGQHAPDCPGAGAGASDTVIVVRWQDDPAIQTTGRVVKLQWDEDEAQP